MPTVTLIPTSTTSEAGWASSNIHTILDDDSSTVAQNASTCNWNGNIEDLDSSLSGATINSVKVTFKAARTNKGNTTADILLRDDSGSNIIAETLSYTDASFTANGCLIYNDTATGDPACAVIAFGGDKTVTSGTFTIQFPTADATNAIIRLA